MSQNSTKPLFDLTNPQNSIDNLTYSIQNFDATIYDKVNSIQYKGFKIAENLTCAFECYYDQENTIHKYKLLFKRHYKTQKTFSGKGCPNFGLKNDDLKNFWKMMNFFYKFQKQFKIEGLEDYYETNITDANLQNALKQINQLSIESKEGVIKALSNLGEEDAKKIQNLSNLIDISKIDNLLQKWDELLQKWDEPLKKNEKPESKWQKLFEDNSWILPQLLLTPLVYMKGHTYMGGKKMNNKDGKETDFLYRNETSRTLTIFEIKTPETKLLGKKYRDNLYPPSHDLVGSVSQVIQQRDIWLSESKKEYGHDRQGDPKKLSPHNTQCVVLIGDLSKLNYNEKQNFEIYRSSLASGILVVTFDELKQKIQNIKDILSQ